MRAGRKGWEWLGSGETGGKWQSVKDITGRYGFSLLKTRTHQQEHLCPCLSQERGCRAARLMSVFSPAGRASESETSAACSAAASV